MCLFFYYLDSFNSGLFDFYTNWELVDVQEQTSVK